MAKLKGIEKLDRIMTEFVEQFGCTAELDKEFCYWHEDELVNYTLVISKLIDTTWKEYVLKTFNYKIENIFMFSILHEIGHHFTMDDFPKRQLNFENRKVKKIEKALENSNSDELDKKLNFEYFDMPMEKVATKWAVNYYKKHRLEINNFWKKFNKELKNFYKVNGLK